VTSEYPFALAGVWRWNNLSSATAFPPGVGPFGSPTAAYVFKAEAARATERLRIIAE
jgi:hypothetical protein